MTGTAHPLGDRLQRVEVTCSRLDARLRPGSDVDRLGRRAQHHRRPLLRPPSPPPPSARGRLVLTLTGPPAPRPDDGQPVTLIARRRPPRSGSAAARKTYRALYSARRSWLTTGRTPTATRRPVPLDVLVAGAERD